MSLELRDLVDFAVLQVVGDELVRHDEAIRIGRKLILSPLRSYQLWLSMQPDQPVAEPLFPLHASSSWRGRR